MNDCLLLWFIQDNHRQNGAVVVVVTEMTESVARSRKAANQAYSEARLCSFLATSQFAIV
jgi:hypothetical protein